MKIEVELDDHYYEALQKILPGIDLGIVAAEVLKHLSILYGSDPESFLRAFGREVNPQNRESFDKRIEELVPHKN